MPGRGGRGEARDGRISEDAGVALEAAEPLGVVGGGLVPGVAAALARRVSMFIFFVLIFGGLDAIAYSS